MATSSGEEAAARIRAIREAQFGPRQPDAGGEPVGEEVSPVVERSVRPASVRPVRADPVNEPSAVSSERMAYEMEAAAHRETIDKLLAEKERLIGVLMGRIGDLENRLELVESALEMSKLDDSGGV